MKNLLKYLMIAAMAAMVCTACSKDDDNPEPISKELDGTWVRTMHDNIEYDIEITFAGDSAVFAKLSNDSGWNESLNKGFISLGTSAKFKDIVRTTDTTWTCSELWYDTWDGSTYRRPAKITMKADYKTFSVTGVSVSDTYMRKTNQIRVE
jgi:hypothetical protein